MAYNALPTSQSSTRIPQADHLQTIQANDSGSGAPNAPATGTVSSNRRRSSTKFPGLKRAFSTPNVRDHTMEEGMPLSSLDKKRNKLGYHRTAVACGHCRRRKIRCITANDEPNGPCQNCIRLKKECQFFPVDQQGTSPGMRPRSGSKVERNIDEREDSVGSSSPRVLSSSALDQIKNMNAQVGTPPLTDDGSGYHSFGGSGSAHEYGTPHDYDYRHGYTVPPQPLYQYPGQSQQRTHFDGPTSQYYSPQDHHPLQNPYTSAPLSGSIKASPQADTHEFPQPSPRSNDFPWTPHPPVRSMSIADTQDLHSMYSAYRSNTFPSIPHRLGRVGEVSHVPQGHPGLVHSTSHQGTFPHQYSPNNYEHMQSTMPWTSTIPTQMTHVPVSSSDNYHPGWYPAQSGLPYVREEDDSIHTIPSQDPSHQRFRPNPG